MPGSSSQSGNIYGATSSRLIVPVYEGKLTTLPENQPTHSLSQSRFPLAGGTPDDMNTSSNSNNYQQQQLHLPGAAATRQRETLHLRERERDAGGSSNFLRLAPGAGAASAAAPIPESNDDYALLLGGGAGR